MLARNSLQSRNVKASDETGIELLVNISRWDSVPYLSAQFFYQLFSTCLEKQFLQDGFLDVCDRVGFPEADA
jgi:hypothetical protein